MKCNVCGRNSQNDEANFCEYCGSSFKETNTAALHSEPREKNYKEVTGDFQDAMAVKMSVNSMGQEISRPVSIEKPISFLNWLGTYGILFIPLIGWLIFFIMLFVWAFSGNTPQSKRNWARVTLIFVAVLIILIIAYMMTLIGSPMFQDMMNGTFNYNDYYNNMLQGVK